MIFVNSNSSHPEHVLKHILDAVNKHIHNIFSRPSTFTERAYHNQGAIKQNGYDKDLI